MKSHSEVCVKLKDIIEEVSLGQRVAKEIADDSRIIADLGLDSLDYATVLFTAESWIGLKVKEEGIVWSQIDTVSKLAQLLVKAQDR